MIVILNGENRDVESGTTIQKLLDELKLDGNALVVQRNDDIIEKADYATIRLDENDQVELVQFVGGG
ncbi:MAG: sulfur carrier protein ThiS [Candidatus Hydrogenedentes bacterium]|nr:sulfur carrier protein ThiS [Candidatus Hydrogenedentota bacterium]